MNKSVKTVIITNIPSPYRVIFFNELSKKMGDNLLVLYCASSEPNRLWKVDNINHNHLFLKKSILNSISSYKYLNLDIISRLIDFNPDIIITGGFYPTMIFAILYSRIKKIKHIINTDGWSLTESQLNFLHKIIRQIVYKSTDLFLPVSEKGKETIKRYGVAEKKIKTIPYVIDNSQYTFNPPLTKKYDLLFSGQFIPRKMPDFFLKVCKRVAAFKKDLSVALIGDGPLKDEILAGFKDSKINFNYLGFVQPKEVPAVFCESKLFLFPTLSDGWGVVTNEACAAGLPTITCENAGAANDIIIHEYNGYVLPLDEQIWSEKICELLFNSVKYDAFAKNALNQANEFSAENIVNRFINTLVQVK